MLPDTNLSVGENVSLTFDNLQLSQSKLLFE